MSLIFSYKRSRTKSQFTIPSPNSLLRFCPGHTLIADKGHNRNSLFRQQNNELRFCPRHTLIADQGHNRNFKFRRQNKEFRLGIPYYCPKCTGIRNCDLVPNLLHKRRVKNAIYNSGVFIRVKYDVR